MVQIDRVSTKDAQTICSSNLIASVNKFGDIYSESYEIRLNICK